MLPPPARMIRRTGLSSFRSSPITARLCSLAATKNTSSSASMTVSPWGMIPIPRRKIAATRDSIDGIRVGSSRSA